MLGFVLGAVFGIVVGVVATLIVWFKAKHDSKKIKNE